MFLILTLLQYMKFQYNAKVLLLQNSRTTCTILLQIRDQLYKYTIELLIKVLMVYINYQHIYDYISFHWLEPIA